jgi:hypothetical protein
MTVTLGWLRLNGYRKRYGPQNPINYGSSQASSQLSSKPTSIHGLRITVPLSILCFRTLYGEMDQVDKHV